MPNTRKTQGILPPPVIWAQRSNAIMLTYNVENCKTPEIRIEENKVYFKGVGGSDLEEKKYENTLELYGKIDPIQSKYFEIDGKIEMILIKRSDGSSSAFWPRLLKQNIKYHWLKVDLARWKDEDDSDDEGPKNSFLEEMVYQLGREEYPDIPDEISASKVLWHAANIGDPKGVRVALKAGVDVNAQAPIFEYTALHYSAHNGFTHIAKMLIEAGANIDAEDNGGATPLILASEHGYDSFVYDLLKAGANPKHKDKFGHTAMHAALESGYGSLIVHLLVMNGGCVNDRDYYGKQPIHYAVGWSDGKDDAIKSLIALKADVNCKDDEGETPLFCALEEGHEKVVETLLRNGAHTNITYQGMQVAHKALIEGHFNILKKLIKYGADINATTEEKQNTLLHLAVEKDHKNLAKWLINNGTNPYIPNAEGNTAIHLALNKGDRKLVGFMASRNKHLTTSEGSTTSTSSEETSSLGASKKKYRKKNA